MNAKQVQCLTALAVYTASVLLLRLASAQAAPFELRDPSTSEEIVMICSSYLPFCVETEKAAHAPGFAERVFGWNVINQCRDIMRQCTEMANRHLKALDIITQNVAIE